MSKPGRPRTASRKPDPQPFGIGPSLLTPPFVDSDAMLPIDRWPSRDIKKVIGLTANPIKLNEIRQERLKALGLNDTANYASMERILKEIEYSENLMKKLGCPVIDVSNKAVEETAGIILEITKNNRYGGLDV